ncbi:hypothetical protein AB0B50_36130 [Streptomyces sp. NPDC041068]|uniref:hypothetical protein n=1 Tax=Streptomyces sp. NPDC041068 TaxID=3155130 RepID=UPI0033C26778
MAIEDFEALVARAEADPAVVGLILSGSRAREGMATEHSDHDVYVVTADGAKPKSLAGRRSTALDVVVLSLGEFRTRGLPGDAYAWDRYAFVHCEIVLDCLDGEIKELVARKATLDPDEARRLTDESLDAYINSLYRSVKSHRDGRAGAAHLDAAESVGWFLTALFALHGRVRPYNKYLEWELAKSPLGAPHWSLPQLLPTLRRILADGDLPTQRELFARLESSAREAGHGEVIDSWGDDVLLLRP